MKKFRKLTAVVLEIMLCVSMLTIGTLSASAFSKDNFKAQIKEIHVGAPITGVDGRRYLPVDIHFTALENLSNEEVAQFLEGYLRVKLKNGTLAEGISGLGMTLMGAVKPDVPLESNMWSWSWSPYETGDGQGVIKYNLPLLNEGEVQTVEKSLATGQEEVNAVTVGDEVTFEVSTVVNTNQFPEDFVKEVFPEGPEVFSNKAPFTIEELSNYPRQYNITAYDTTEPETTEETTVEATAETSTAEVTTEATEPTTAQETTAPVTTEATEPTTAAPEATTEAPQVTTEAPQATTEAPKETTVPATDVPQPTTEPAQPTTSAEAVADKPTEAPATPATEIVNPTKPGGSDIQPATQEPTQAATEAPTQPVTEAAEFKTSIGKSTIKIGETTVISVEGGSGEVKFTSKNPKVATVDKDGKVKGVSAGKAEIKVEKGSDNKTYKVTVKKKDGLFTVKGITVKAKKNKKTTVKLYNYLELKNAKGNITYVKTGGNSKIKVSKSGKLTVKKGLKRGKTYKVNIKLTDSGNSTYASKSASIVVKVKITK